MRDIARALGRSVSTISDELRLNCVEGVYDPAKAHHKAYVRRKYARYQGKKIIHHDALRKEVTARLYDDQSPEAISGYIAGYRKNLPSVSKDSIYRFIKSVYGRRIETHRFLRRQRRRRRRTPSAFLLNRTFIDQRPRNINTRKQIGNAEADFIVSGKTGQGILLVVVDRKSRVSFLERITKSTIQNVHAAFSRIKSRFPELRTLTMDNDILFARHDELAKLLQVKIYFCHPYHSWEKGTVENTNKVIRREIPKGSSILRYSKLFIERIEQKLNRRPMKCIEYQTPQEVLDMYRDLQRNKKHAHERCSD